MPDALFDDGGGRMADLGQGRHSVTRLSGYGRCPAKQFLGALYDRARPEPSAGVAAAKLGTPHLNLHGTGLDAQGLPVRPVQRANG